MLTEEKEIYHIRHSHNKEDEIRILFFCHYCYIYHLA